LAIDDLAILPVPEIRDYDRINAEVAQRLNDGVTHVVLAGVDRQRLLCLRLRGPWLATIEIQGNPGPELAAEMDAPGVTILCRGSAADGAGRGLIDGLLLVEGCVGDALGYCQRGGTILVTGDAGHRAGLMQAGGNLIVLGSVGRLAGERQSGGVFVYQGGNAGPYMGHGHRAGRLISFPVTASSLSADDQAAIDQLVDSCGEYLPAGLLRPV
jgi:glutamate synthase domain-containing protein 3